jgi:hypothetical protein
MKKLTAVTIYSIAMGYLESAVVIYIREMIFRDATQVLPFRLLEPRLAILEIGREVATIAMLAAVGYLAGKDRLERWLMFIYSFAIWDIVYYVVLKIAVGWPASFFTLDVLFLIPVVWIGPVIAPVLISALLAIGSATIQRIRIRKADLRLRPSNFWLFLGGCVLVLYSFTAQIFHILLTAGPKGLENYTPETFHWVLFVTGYLVMCAAVAKTIMESYHTMRSANPD